MVFPKFRKRGYIGNPEEDFTQVTPGELEYEHGYNEGFDDGKDDAFDQGKAKGFEMGVAKGKAKGCNRGFAKCRAKGKGNGEGTAKGGRGKGTGEGNATEPPWQFVHVTNELPPEHMPEHRKMVEKLRPLLEKMRASR